jgi:hypothetical protein
MLEYATESQRRINGSNQYQQPVPATSTSNQYQQPVPATRFFVSLMMTDGEMLGADLPSLRTRAYRPRAPESR